MPSSVCRQVCALVRRYGICISRRPINSLIRIIIWPGLIFALCFWAICNPTGAYDSTMSKYIFAGGLVNMLTLTTIFHLYSFEEYMVKDKETGFKTLMISMGLRPFSYYLANAICMLLTLWPIAIIFAIVSKIYVLHESESSNLAIIFMFTLFTIHLILFTLVLVSFLSSTNYASLLFILIVVELSLEGIVKAWAEASDENWQRFILFMAGVSPYESIRIFTDSYILNKNNGTTEFREKRVSQPTYLILISMACWPILTVVVAQCIKWLLLATECEIIDDIRRCLGLNNKNARLEQDKEDEKQSSSSKYFERPAGNRDVGIRIQHVTKNYRSVTALNDVSFDVHKGETTMLLGHNGAGKTTLMNIILGLLQPDTGQVSIKKGKDEAFGVGVCPQTSVLDEDLSVEQHVALFADIKSNLSGYERDEHVRQIVEEVSLGAHRQKRPSELSGGMKRKLSLGMATVGRSEVLILDEPSSGLDPDSRMFVWNAIRRYRTDRTVLLTTQHMGEADYLGDRIAIMSEGRVVCCGSSIFLNNLFGSGYKLRVECDASKKATIVKHIRSYFRESKEADTGQTSNGDDGRNGKEPVDFVLELRGLDKNADSELHMIKLLEDLESNCQKLGIKSFGLKSSSIEDVMLETSQFFSSRPKDATQLTLESAQAHLKTLADCQNSNQEEDHIYFALLMKHIRTNLANWMRFLILRLVAPSFAAWYVADGLNPRSERYVGNSPFSPKLINVFLVFHFVYYPVLERATKFKVVQLTSKANYLAYWLSQASIDLITVLTNTTLVNVMFVVLFEGNPVVSLWTIHAILTGATILFGVAGMTLSYVLSTVLIDPKHAVGHNLLFNNVGLFSMIIVCILKLAMPTTKLVWLSDTSTYLFVSLFPADAFQFVQWGLVSRGYINSDSMAIPYVVPDEISPVIFGLVAMSIQFVAYMALLILIEAQNFDLEWYSRPSNLCSCLFGPKKTSSDKQRLVDDDVVNEATKATSVIKNVPRDTYSLVAANLNKSYYVHSPIVEDLSFTVGKGECFGLLGLNGAGKSTTFSMLIAESAPDSGQVWANGLYSDESLSRYREKLGYDSERTPDISLSPYEALYLMARLRKVPESRIPVLINSVLELLEMSQHTYKLTSELSGGMKRKLALGMALIGSPDLLVLDEPTAGVDPVARRVIWRLLNTLKKLRSTSIIISSHGMEECEAICDRISAMAQGRLLCVGTLFHLRSKFAQGCTLKVQWPTPPTTTTSLSHSGNASGAKGIHEPVGGGSLVVSELKQRLERALVGSTNSVSLSDQDLKSATFSISDNRVRRSLLFKIMSEFRQKHSNISYMINDTSLEDIFVSISRRHQKEFYAAS